MTNKKNTQQNFQLEQLIKENQLLKAENYKLCNRIAEFNTTEAKYLSVFETSTDAIFLIDDSWKIIDVNLAASEMFGRSKKNLKKSLFTSITPNIKFSSLKPSRIVARGDLFFQETQGYRMRSDKTFPIEVTIRKLKKFQDKLFFVHIHDITEKQKTLDELKLLVTAIEQASETVMITDSKGIIQYVNQAFEENSGYTKEEVLGKSPSIFKSGKQSSQFYSKLWNLISQGQTWKGELINLRKDRSEYKEDVAISPVFNGLGQINNFVAVKKDITVEHELENQLRESQKLEAIGTLAGGIAHDFNNILSAIMGYAELSLFKTEDKETITNSLTRIMSASSRAKELIDQILTFSRKNELTRKVQNISAVVADTVSLIKVTAPSGVKVETSIDSFCYADANAGQLRQVILNLCTNAFYAMKKKGGTLDIELKPDKYYTDSTEKSIRITVSDTGTGIPADIVDRIFDPYFTTKPQEDGTGLGLSVTHGIVRSHGGHIKCFSETDKGTTFTLWIPQAITTEYSSEEEQSQIPSGKGKILVVDDEPYLAELTTTFLKDLGYQVTSYSDSEKALSHLTRQNADFDLLITDFKMPAIDGIELIRILRETDNSTPAIICSGFIADIPINKLDRLSGTSTIQKPVNLRELGWQVHDIMDRDE